MSDRQKIISLVCPGAPITRAVADKVTQTAQHRFGERVQLNFSDQCFETDGHFAGGDASRSAAFTSAANDPQSDAVWFAKGGYGACRLDDKLWRNLNENARRKTYLGYSDTGVLLGRLYREGIGKPVHGPMAIDIERDNGDRAIIRALEFLMDEGDNSSIEPAASVEAPIAAFNITVLAHMLTGSAMPDLTDHVVLLEDVGEYLYRTDRAMSAIVTSPMIAGAAGIRLGRLSQIPENDRPFGASGEEIVQYWCARAGLSYLGRADIGHDSDNKIVPFGNANSS